MRSAAELLNRAIPETKQQSQQTRHSGQTLTTQFLKATLQELTRMGLLNSPTAETYQTWARGLADFDERMIRNGLVKARDFKGFFTLPAFRELCRFQPEDFGIPDVRDAFDEIYRTQFGKTGSLSHPVVHHAMSECGVYELSHLSEKEAFRRYEYYHSVVSKRFIAGEEMSLPVREAIPENIERPKTPQEIELARENASKAMASLRKMLGAA